MIDPQTKRTIDLAKALWPIKTGEELACRCGVTVRAANMWLDGQRKLPASILRAIANELWSRRPRPLKPHGPGGEKSMGWLPDPFRRRARRAVTRKDSSTSPATASLPMKRSWSCSTNCDRASGRNVSCGSVEGHALIYRYACDGRMERFESSEARLRGGEGPVRLVAGREDGINPVPQDSSFQCRSESNQRQSRNGWGCIDWPRKTIYRRNGVASRRGRRAAVCARGANPRATIPAAGYAALGRGPRNPRSLITGSGAGLASFSSDGSGLKQAVGTSDLLAGALKWDVTLAGHSPDSREAAGRNRVRKDAGVAPGPSGRFLKSGMAAEAATCPAVARFNQGRVA